MVSYTIIVILSILLVYLAQTTMKTSKALGFSISFINVSFLALLAALRDYTVGVDFLFYFRPCFEAALRAKSYADCVLGMKYGEELCYSFLLYSTSRITDSPRLAMGLIEFITVGSILIAAHKYNRYVPSWVFFGVFMITYYVGTFNLIRQFAATGILLWAFTEYRGRWGGKKWLFLSLLAMGFHKTSILAVLIMLVAGVITHSDKKTGRNLLILFLIGLTALVVGLAILLERLGEVMPALARYNAYANTKEDGRGWQQAVIPYRKIFTYGLFLGITYFLYWKKSVRWNVFCLTFIYTSLVVGSQLLGMYTAGATRLTIYFLPTCFALTFRVLREDTYFSKPTDFIIGMIIFLDFAQMAVRDISAVPKGYLTSEILGI